MAQLFEQLARVVQRANIRVCVLYGALGIFV